MAFVRDPDGNSVRIHKRKASDKIYFCSTDGYVTVIEAAREFTRLRQQMLP
jgi:hypothetical protein